VCSSDLYFKLFTYIGGPENPTLPWILVTNNGASIYNSEDTKEAYRILYDAYKSYNKVVYFYSPNSWYIIPGYSVLLSTAPY
jgi:hypothetical protein